MSWNPSEGAGDPNGQPPEDAQPSHGFTGVDAAFGNGEDDFHAAEGGELQEGATNQTFGGDPGILFSAATMMASVPYAEVAPPPNAGGAAADPPPQQPGEAIQEQSGPLSFAAAMIASVPYAEEATAAEGGYATADHPNPNNETASEEPEPLAYTGAMATSDQYMDEGISPTGEDYHHQQPLSTATEAASENMQSTVATTNPASFPDPFGEHPADSSPHMDMDTGSGEHEAPPTSMEGMVENPSVEQAADPPADTAMDVDMEEPEPASAEPTTATDSNVSGGDVQVNPPSQTTNIPEVVEPLSAPATTTTMASDLMGGENDSEQIVPNEPTDPPLEGTMASDGEPGSLPTTTEEVETVDQAREDSLSPAEKPSGAPADSPMADEQEPLPALDSSVEEKTEPVEPAPAPAPAGTEHDDSTAQDGEDPSSMATTFSPPNQGFTPPAGDSQLRDELFPTDLDPFGENNGETMAPTSAPENQEPATMDWEESDPFSISMQRSSDLAPSAEEANAPASELDGQVAPVASEVAIGYSKSTAMVETTEASESEVIADSAAAIDGHAPKDANLEEPPLPTRTPLTEASQLNTAAIPEDAVAESSTSPPILNVEQTDRAEEEPSQPLPEGTPNMEVEQEALPTPAALEPAPTVEQQGALAAEGTTSTETSQVPAVPPGDSQPAATEPNALSSPSASDNASSSVAESNPAIRFAKDEIVAVYLGEGEPGECEYGFVKLLRDVLYEDYVKAPDDNVNIEWYAAIIDEKKRGKNITILYPEPMPDVVPLDSLICAVSHHAVLHVYPNGDEFLEFSNKSVRPHIEARLKVQLADEYDPAVTARHDDRDELFHEARLAKLRDELTNKKSKSKTTKKRRRSGPTKKKKSSENGHKRGSEKKAKVPTEAPPDQAINEPAKSIKQTPKATKRAPAPATKPPGPARSKTSGTSSKASSSQSRKNVKKHSKVLDYDDSIRFGAEEIVVVYLGEGDSEFDCDYGFVKLAVDVLYDDYITAAEDDVAVEWFAGIIDEEKRGKEITILYPEPAMDSVPIGSLICAITHQVSLHRHPDGTELFEFVNKRVRPRIEEKLKIQLADDYDPAISARDDDKDEPIYEKRLSILKGQFDKMKKRSRQEKKQREEEDGDYEDDGDVGRSPTWKKRKTQQGGITSSSQNEEKIQGSVSSPTPKRGAGANKKGKPSRNRRPYVDIEPEVWSNKSGKVGTFCGDTYRASKEVIRAVRTGSTKILLPKLIQDSKKTVGDLFVQQSADVPLTSVDYAFVMEDKASLRMLFEASRRNQDGGPPDSEGRVEFPICTLLEQSSGEPVGFEGNSDFMMDNNTAKGRFNLGRDRICELLTGFDAVSVNFIKFVKDAIFSDIFNYNFPIDILLRTGHRELTEYAMKVLQNKGVELDSLHVAALGAAEWAKKEKFEASSVTKLSAGGGNVRFCPIHCAATNPDPFYVQQLLKIAPGAIEMRDSQDATVLHYAAVSEKPTTLQWLLKTYDQNVVARDGKTRKSIETPLFWAARAARAENIRVLCHDLAKDKLKKQSTAFNSEGLTVLHVAASSYRSTRIATVKALLEEAGISADIPGDAHSMEKITPSMIAARQGDLEMLEVLVEAGGADLSARDKQGRTLAIWASMNGHLHVLSYLIREGVDVEAQDFSGSTAMHYAAAYGWVECVKLMLKHGASCDPKNRWLSSPLSLSLKRGSYACSQELLSLKEKVDVNLCDHAGRSLFSSWVGTYASQSSEGSLDTPLPWPVKRMFESENLNISSTDSKNRTVLHYIAESRNATRGNIHELVLNLLDRGLDPLIADINGDTAASLALRDGDWQLVKTLCDKVSHANAPIAPGGSSLLHLLIERMADCENTELFFKIFDCVSNSERQSHFDDLGRTPLLLAAGELRTFDDIDDPRWPRVKLMFEGLVDRMQSHIVDVLGRKRQFAVWSEVEKFLIATNREVNWEPRDEYSEEDRMFCTVFHVLCSTMDTEWASKMFVKCIDLVKDRNVTLNELLNFKLDTSATPFALLCRNLDTRLKTQEQKQGAVRLVTLLKENGADFDSIPFYLFDSLEEVHDVDNDMEDQLDTVSGTEEEKLRRVQEFSVRQQRHAVRRKLQEKEVADLEDALRPYLHHLIDAGRTELLEILAPLVNVNRKDLNGNTGIHVAVGSGSVDVTRIIVPYGDVNAMNSKGVTPLMTASEKGHLLIVLDLIKAGANLSYCSPALGNALHAAVRGGHTQVLEVLLSNSASSDVDAIDSEGRTPLHIAVAYRVSEGPQLELKPCEKQLIAAGANLNAKDDHGRTPMFYAFIPLEADMQCSFPSDLGPCDPFELVTLLASYRVELDVTDVHQRNLMHIAAAVGASTCVLWLAEIQPELMHSKDVDLNTPLGVALLAKHWDTSLLLVNKGSPLDAEVTHVERKWKDKMLVESSRSRHSTLWHAIRGNPALSTYMLSLAGYLPMEVVLSTLFSTGRFQQALSQIQQCQNKEQICFVSNDGMTALHLLAQAPSFADAHGFDIALADFLIECGVPVDSICKRGFTVIHYCAYHGHLELARHLLNLHGYLADSGDIQSQTPLASSLSGSCPSSEMMYELLSSSKNAPGMANSTLEGSRSQKLDEALRSLADPEARMFDTKPADRRSKDALISRISEDEGVSNMAESGTEYKVSSYALIEAVRKEELTIVNMLLSYGADPNVADAEKRTAYHHAAIQSNFDMLALLLRHSNSSIDSVDNHGFTALSYVLLRSFECPKSRDACLELLLDYGADPQVGNSMFLAAKHNMELCLSAMLFRGKNSLQPAIDSAPNPGLAYSEQDAVWVRFGGVRGSWQLATVIQVNGDNLTVVPGKAEIPTDERELRCIAISGVSSQWVRRVNFERDVPCAAADVLENQFTAGAGFENDRTTLLGQRRGAEMSLIGEFDRSHPSVESVLSLQVDVGEIVGVFSNDDYSLQQMGAIVTAYPNGLYDIQLYCGTVRKQVERTRLRKLRDELKFYMASTTRQIEYKIIEACLQTVSFGSFENVAMLKELCDAGAPLDATLLHLVRPGSKMEEFLISKLGTTANSQGMQLSEGEGPPALLDIDLINDAAASLKEFDDTSDKMKLALSSMLEASSIPSSLDMSLAGTLHFLSDVDMLVSTLETSGLNHSNFSISQLSFDTLDKAEAKLQEIKVLLDSIDLDDYDEGGAASKIEKVAALTNDYYDLIPVHNEIGTPFEVNDERVGKAMNLVRLLRDLAVTKQLLLGAMHRQSKYNPIDYVYRAVQMGMKPVETFSRERDILERYIDSTCSDDVVVNEIFALDNGVGIPEDIGNKRLLFYGSKNENVVGTLKQGLRIAPAEALTSEFSYGNGVYLTDKFSKALSFSSEMTDGNIQKQPRSYVFVAEAMIGKPYVALGATHVDGLQPGTDSTFAPGRSLPDPSLDLVLDSTGALVPLGRLVDTNLTYFEWTAPDGSSSEISAEQSLEIERVRTDPYTQFPAKVRVRINGQKVEMDAILESPLSEVVTLVPMGRASKGKRKNKLGGKESDITGDGDKMLIDGVADDKDGPPGENAPPPEQDDIVGETIQDMFGDGSSDESDDEVLPPISLHTAKGKNESSITLVRKAKKPNSTDNEFIVYDTKQIRLKYLVELTTPAWVEKEYKSKSNSKRHLL